MTKSPVLHPYPFDKPLFFVGMMGSGKTTFGRRMASLYDLPFLDTDIELEKAGGADIAYLFERFGEVDFRRAEERIIERLLDGTLCVISSGGGSFISEKTRALVRKKAITIFLNADIESIYNNTQGRTHRPLLNVKNPKEVIEKLLHQRIKYYQEANIHVKYKHETLNQVAQMIVSEINLFAQGGKNE